MEKILFPVKIMNITQGMNGVYSHKGIKAIDCGWVNEENKKLYAPFTGIVKQINSGSNAVWFQSKEKVIFADGTVDYATVRTLHDNDISDLYVGKEIKQGEYYYKMGNKGNVTGVHVHIEISKGHVTGYRSKNKYGNYEMPNTINVYDGFCLTDSTVVQDGKDYSWKYEKDVVATEPEKKDFNIGDDVIINGNLYKSADADSPSGSVSNKTTKITRYVTGTKHPYNTTGDLGWMNTTDINLVVDDTKETLYLPASADSWRVYPMDKQPVVGNECGKLLPSKFGGLTYDILGWTTKNTAIIQTRDFGKVQIYVAQSTGAVIS